MSEANSWTTLRDCLKPAHVQRFEDKLTGGIPDCYVKQPDRHGMYLEGKYLAEYPVRDSTLIKVGLRSDQQLWLRKQRIFNGHAYVWLRAPDGWWIFDRGFLALFKGVLRSDMELYGVRFDVAADAAAYLRSCTAVFAVNHDPRESFA